MTDSGCNRGLVDNAFAFTKKIASINKLQSLDTQVSPKIEKHVLKEVVSQHPVPIRHQGRRVLCPLARDRCVHNDVWNEAWAWSPCSRSEASDPPVSLVCLLRDVLRRGRVQKASCAMCVDRETCRSGAVPRRHFTIFDARRSVPAAALISRLVCTLPVIHAASNVLCTSECLQPSSCCGRW